VDSDTLDPIQLTNEGGGKYQLQKDEVFKPNTFTVTSNFGGSATANVANG
jgi:hypothetical protein